LPRYFTGNEVRGCPPARDWHTHHIQYSWPVTNPALAESQVLGAPSEELGEKLVQVLYHLGSKHALVVHGLNGMDEMSVAGKSRVWELQDEVITDYQGVA
jgi:anthranilate phosphoribosyltransferase